MSNFMKLNNHNDVVSTPNYIFNPLNEEFHFTLDVASTKENAKCKDFFTIEDDGLSKEWYGIAWCNPPYSDTGKWVKKAYESAMGGVTSVLLIPASTDTKYFHEYIYNKINVEIRFLKGRIKFDGYKTRASFASMIVIFYGIK